MSDGYIHGFSADEQRRLTLMQSILNGAELRVLDLRDVRTVLDVGCGLAQMSRAIARVLGPGGRVVAVERDARQRAAAEQQAHADGEAGLVELRAGDAERLPLADDERGTFDLAHARFLLEHVPDPAAVVREMLSAVRPGGRLALLDDDHELLRVDPPCPPLDLAWRRYWESYRDRGLDPLVGRRLPTLLRDAGAVSVSVTTVFYGATHGEPLFAPVVTNLVGVLEGAAAGLAADGRLSRDEMREALDAFRRWSERADATVWYSLPYAEGRRRRE